MARLKANSSNTGDTHQLSIWISVTYFLSVCSDAAKALHEVWHCESRSPVKIAKRPPGCLSTKSCLGLRQDYSKLIESIGSSFQTMAQVVRVAVDVPQIWIVCDKLLVLLVLQMLQTTAKMLTPVPSRISESGTLHLRENTIAVEVHIQLPKSI